MDDWDLIDCPCESSFETHDVVFDASGKESSISIRAVHSICAEVCSAKQALDSFPGVGI